MNKAQEGAWFGLFVSIPMSIIPGVAILLAYDGRMMFFTPLLTAAFMAFWVGLLLWLVPSLQRFRKTRIFLDERDEFISKRAATVAYTVLWLYFIAACIIPWAIAGPKGSISVNILPLMLFGGLAIFTFVHALATLIQYGWKEKSNE